MSRIDQLASFSFDQSLNKKNASEYEQIGSEQSNFEKLLNSKISIEEKTTEAKPIKGSFEEKPVELAEMDFSIHSNVNMAVSQESDISLEGLEEGDVFVLNTDDSTNNVKINTDIEGPVLHNESGEINLNQQQDFPISIPEDKAPSIKNTNSNDDGVALQEDESEDVEFDVMGVELSQMPVIQNRVDQAPDLIEGSNVLSLSLIHI